jgi:sugar/nucleoside kinase (ribokinase family)
MNIVCVGDCGIDHYLPSGEKRFGGITANVARHARNEFPADDEIRIVSCVGDDDGAELVLSSLADTNIDCHIEQLPGTTPVQYIEVEEDGERNFVRYDEGVLRDFSLGSTARKIIAASDLLIAPVYLQIVDLFDDLMNIGTAGLTAIDFADFIQHPDFELLERHLANIDIGFFGLSVTDTSAIQHIGKLAAEHDKLFIITLGPDGSRAFRGSERFDCPAVPLENIVDTTGAGDAFAAAFLSRYCHGVDVVDSMQHGAVLAADVAGKLGSWG